MIRTTKTPAPRPMARVLVLDDEPLFSAALVETMQKYGIAAEATRTPREALERVRTFGPDVLLTDVRMPEADGFAMLEAIHRVDPFLPVVLVTGYATVPDAVRAMEAGAEYYVAKPVTTAEILRVVGRAIERRRARRPRTARAADAGVVAPELIGASQAMTALREQIEVAAEGEAPVLLSGEAGSGKARVASAIHAASARRGGAFVRVRCAASDVVEVFAANLASAIAHAPGGTVYIDGVDAAAPAAQAALVAALDAEGGPRVVSSSRGDLAARVAAGAFRPDLYYRLAALHIEVPPLRARRDDVSLLVEHALARRAEAQQGGGGALPEVTPAAMRVLVAYDWPGNVRELENVVDAALLIARGGPITPEVLASALRPPSRDTEAPALPGATIAAIERHAILTTYEACGRSARRAAKILGISVRAVQYRLREYRGEPGRRAVVPASRDRKRA